jgi:hypothetical protein
MGRNHFKSKDGDRINVLLAATGFNGHLLSDPGLPRHRPDDKTRLN